MQPIHNLGDPESLPRTHARTDIPTQNPTLVPEAESQGPPPFEQAVTRRTCWLSSVDIEWVEEKDEGDGEGEGEGEREGEREHAREGERARD